MRLLKICFSFIVSPLLILSSLSGAEKIYMLDYMANYPIANNYALVADDAKWLCEKVPYSSNKVSEIRGALVGKPLSFSLFPSKMLFAGHDAIQQVNLCQDSVKEFMVQFFRRYGEQNSAIITSLEVKKHKSKAAYICNCRYLDGYGPGYFRAYLIMPQALVLRRTQSILLLLAKVDGDSLSDGTRERCFEEAFSLVIPIVSLRDPEELDNRVVGQHDNPPRN